MIRAMNVGVRAAALAALLLIACAASAATAGAASPAWKVLGVTGPTNLPPVQSEIQRVAVDAEGGTYTLTFPEPAALGSGKLSFGKRSASYASGSTTVTLCTLFFCPLTGAFEVGQTITSSGAGIPAGTTITAIAGATLTISQPTTAGTAGLATVTGASKQVTNVTTSQGTFAAGQTISGTNIPAGTTIESVGTGTLTISAFPTGPGTPALTAVESTGPIPFDADAATLEAALDALSLLEVAVGGGPGGSGLASPYFVTFGGGLEDEDAAELIANGGGLVGDGSQAVAVHTMLDGGPGTGAMVVHLGNVGGASSSGTLTLQIGPLPAGIETSGDPNAPGWSCSNGEGLTEVTCTRTVVGGVGSVGVETQAAPVLVPLRVEDGTPPSSTVPISVEGGGALPAGGDEYTMPVTVSTVPAPAGVQALWAGAFDEDGQPYTQAGGHPARAGAFFRVNTVRNPAGRLVAAGDLRDIDVEVPPGFAGNPLATERCPTENVVCGDPDAIVGRVQPAIFEFFGGGESNPLYNNVPKTGYPAQFSFKYVDPNVTLLGGLRSERDYGVTVTAYNTPLLFDVYGSFAMLNGFPPGAEGAPFLSNPTGCSVEAQGTPVTTIAASSWQAPSLFDRATVELPPVTGCEQLKDKFKPDFTFQPSSNQPASTTAATAHLHIDQSGLLEAEELATPHLKRSVVELPPGLGLNPAGANGLEACSTEQIGLITTSGDDPNPIRFDKSSPDCPDASKVGTVEVASPLIEDPLQGVVYLAEQDDNPFGSLVAIYLVIDDPRTGITIKLPGEIKPDPDDGQITAVFDHNPQLPFEDLTLKIRGGDRGSLATPDTCGTHTTKGTWTPWSAPESGPPATTTDSFEVSAAGCPATKAQRPFAPHFSAGTTEPRAGAHSPLAVRLTRPDGHKELRGVEMTLPPGLTAALKGVAICSDAALAAARAKSGGEEIASPSCPASSRIASLSVGAGVGPSPLYVQTGKLYLTGPHKGAPLSISAVVPAVAGPFDLGVQVIQSAAHVDPRTALISVSSDPLPTILEGVPLQIRDVRIDVDRPSFTLNPTSCQVMSIAAEVLGEGGASAGFSERFQVGECARLGFRPRMSLRLLGGTERGDYQGLRAVVRPRPGDANIGRTVLRMPRSAFLAQEHIRTVCTRVQFAADACPKNSIYGKAIALTPLLDYPLQGNVYLRSSDNELPDLVADLRGPAHQPIRVELVGRTDSVRGALRNTFDVVPDAPVSYFRLQLFGRDKGLIVNSRDICSGKNRATVHMDAHNGSSALLHPRLLNKRCAKQRRAQAKKRRAAKRSGHRSKLR